MNRVRVVTACLVGAIALIAAACTPPPDDPGGTDPVAVLQASPTTGAAPFSVTFTSVGSAVPAGATWTWSFGAGEGTSSTVGSVSHVYNSPGTYSATLTIAAGGKTSTSDPVVITVEAPPVANAYFVRTNGVDTPDCGPIEDPCETIDQGQVRAIDDGRPQVRVAGGAYGRFTVRSGLTVQGGWNQTFTARGPADVTTVNGSFDGGVGTNWALRANNISAPTTVFGITVLGPTAGAGQTTTGVLVDGSVSGLTLDSLVVAGGVGQNATGVLATGNVSLTVRNSTVNSGTPVGAGNSAYGVRALSGAVVAVVDSTVTAQAGVAGASSTTPTPGKAGNGCNGNNGQDGRLGSTLEGPRRAGGASCGGSGVTRSGRGGDGGTWTFCCPLNYAAGLAGESGGGGAAGGAGGSASGTSGGNGGGGTNGTPGASGAPGQGGANSALAPGDLWVGRPGTGGAVGGAGGGGGGGGGGGSASTVAPGGGSGGGGGQGGQPGTGVGAAGGGSFGIYAHNATVTVNGSTVTSNSGGNGGSGSPAGAAGDGGTSGVTGSRPTAQTGFGGTGGNGAGGGGGGGAGGGAGGPSVAIYHSGTGTLTINGGTQNRPLAAAVGGSGGSGGAGGGGPLGGPAGQNGATGATGLNLRVWDNGATTV